MVGFIGPWEFLLLALIILFFFGAKRFTAAGRALGRGMKEFKRSVSDEDGGEREELPPSNGQKTV